MCASTKTSAFREQLGFILTTNPIGHNVEHYKKTILQEYQTDRKGQTTTQAMICTDSQTEWTHFSDTKKVIQSSDITIIYQGQCVYKIGK